MFFNQFGGFGGGASMGVAPLSENTAHYVALEIEKGASDVVVRKAYRMLAMKHHPDKGGDPEKFKEISKAYEILSDPVARKNYDDGCGENASVPGASDIFTSMFGAKTRRRTDDVVLDIHVSLNELYVGCAKKISIQRKIINRQDGVVKMCPQCGGKGVKVEVLRMGSMLQQIQTQCGACGGLGKTCGYLSEQTDVQVFIPRGALDGHRIVCQGLTDECLDSDPGDLVFVVRQLPHASFVRRNNDLYIRKEISIIEALCGFDIEVEHLDGRCLAVKSPSGEIVHLSEKVDPSNPPSTWETFEDQDCTMNTVAEAATDNVEVLRRACEKDLREKGIQSDAFVVVGKKGYFKQGTAEEVSETKVAAPGKTLHLCKPHAQCMLYAIEAEGMPISSNTCMKGNLFLDLTLSLPTSIADDTLTKLRALLPAPLNRRSSDDLDECEAILMDSIKSYGAYANLRQPDDDPQPLRSEVRGPECPQQ